MDLSEKDFDLIDCVFLYKSEGKYPSKCSDSRKSAIRMKASKFKLFNIRDEILYFQKKKKGQYSLKTIELRYFQLEIKKNIRKYSKCVVIPLALQVLT
jgi:hypothetical protein